MLRPTMDTLLGDDVGASVRPSDAANMGAFAWRAPTRNPGVTAPTAGAPTIPAAAGATRKDGPVALGPALAHLDRMANGARDPSSRGTDEASGRRIRTLIRTMAQANPRWGAPRIHGELLKLRIDVCQATAAKYMGRRRQPPSQTWRTFLENHIGQIVAADFFVVPTATYRLLFVLVLLAHDRRRIRTRRCSPAALTTMTLSRHSRRTDDFLRDGAAHRTEIAGSGKANAGLASMNAPVAGRTADEPYGSAR